MRDQAWFDQLAFGVSAPKVSRQLGLFFDAEEIGLCQSRVGRGRPILDQVLHIPVPQGQKKLPEVQAHVLGEEFFSDVEKSSSLLTAALSKLNDPPQDVAVVLSSHFSLLRYFHMPFIEKRFWATAVPIEGRKYIPFPPAALSQDFQVFEAPSGLEVSREQRVLTAAAAKAVEVGIRDLLQKLKLRVISIEPDSCAALRFLGVVEKDVAGKLCLWVHIDERRAWVIASDRGIPVFSRELKMDPAVGRWDLRSLGLSGCVDFVSRKMGLGAVGKFIVSGPGSSAAISAALSQEAGIAAEIKDVGAPLGIRACNWMSCASVGGSIRGWVETPVVLNLFSSLKVNDEDRKAARMVLSVAGVVSAVIFSLGLWAGARCWMKFREASSYGRGSAVASVFRGKTPQQIDEIIAGAEKKAALIGGFPGQAGLSLVGVLKDLSDSIPENAWITGLDFHRSSSAGGDQMTLNGHASGSSVTQEQSIAADFKSRLGQAPIFKKMFNRLEMSLDTKEPSGSGWSGQYAQGIEKRTTFVITASQPRPGAPRY